MYSLSSPNARLSFAPLVLLLLPRTTSLLYPHAIVTVIIEDYHDGVEDSN
jgi:hypothetical protein